MTSTLKAFLVLSLFSLVACGGGEMEKNEVACKCGGDKSLFSTLPLKNLEEPNSPYGLWESNKVSKDSKTSYVTRLLIEEKRTTRARLCSFPGDAKLVAQVEAPSKIVDDLLITEEDVEQTEAIVAGNAHLRCKTELRKETEKTAPELSIVDGVMKINDGSGLVFRKIGN